MICKKDLRKERWNIGSSWIDLPSEKLWYVHCVSVFLDRKDTEDDIEECAVWYLWKDLTIHDETAESYDYLYDRTLELPKGYYKTNKLAQIALRHYRQENRRPKKCARH